jgi:hypothetical protein
VKLNRICLAYCAVLILVSGHVIAATAKIPIAETGQKVVIEFEQREGAGLHVNPFTIIHIRSTDKTYLIESTNVFDSFPISAEERRNNGFWLNIPGLTLDPSLYCLRADYREESKHHTLLFFISRAGASDAAALLVLGFTEEGSPYKVLESNQLDMTSFEIGSDGSQRIIGRPTMSQVMAGDGSKGSKAPYATTYDPFAVYVVHTGTRALYSLTESRAYNQRHYLWAGPKSREDFAVL